MFNREKMQFWTFYHELSYVSEYFYYIMFETSIWDPHKIVEISALKQFAMLSDAY